MGLSGHLMVICTDVDERSTVLLKILRQTYFRLFGSLLLFELLIMWGAAQLLLQVDEFPDNHHGQVASTLQ